MLYIVATPIGNLGDITKRGIETLQKVPLIIAENPLHTGKLLKYFDLDRKELIQFADHNEERILPKIIEKLENTDAALVSDAGSPGISDPGFRLVRACVEKGIPVSPIPGPNAGLSALAASGLPTDRFLFVGFLPKTVPKLEQVLQEAQAVRATLIAYESPQRVVKTVALIAELAPRAHVVIARELTKIHEEFIRGSGARVLQALKAKSTIKGEITLIVSYK